MPRPWGILGGDGAKEICDSKDTSVLKPASTNPNHSFIMLDLLYDVESEDPTTWLQETSIDVRAFLRNQLWRAKDT